MRIGILTFHWAANYGAVLQNFALKTYLEQQGHSVSTINYKPYFADNTLWGFICNKKYKNVCQYIEDLKKDRALQTFRNSKLNLTKRVGRFIELEGVVSDYDVIISGSDQVLNPSFLRNGDGFRVDTPSYFLNFTSKSIKIGYALSFGCTKYPNEDVGYATRLMQNFDKIGVRENSGIYISSQLGRQDAIIVPDPTLLLDSSVYSEIASIKEFSYSKPYFYCFILRNVKSICNSVKKVFGPQNMLLNNEDNNYSMEAWLNKIKNSSFVLTDSFHCVMMCLKLHKPFIAITTQKGNIGMNDRLYTILGKVGLEGRIIHIDNLLNGKDRLNLDVDWINVEQRLDSFAMIGKHFLDFDNINHYEGSSN